MPAEDAEGIQKIQKTPFILSKFFSVFSVFLLGVFCGSNSPCISARLTIGPKMAIIDVVESHLNCRAGAMRALARREARPA